MASSGKKGKKNKGTTLSLNNFLAGSATTGVALPRKTTSSWADDIDDDFDKTRKVVLPSAPRSTLGVDDSQVPRNPPFTAYVSNLPYEVDKEDLYNFFKDLQIADIRMPSGDRPGTGARKGCAYVDFEDRKSLISALNMSDTMLKTRTVRIILSENAENDRRRMRDMGRDRSDGPDRTLSDWRSGPRDEPPDDRGYGRDRDGGFDRGGRPGNRREFGFRDNFNERGPGGFRDDRGGRGFGDDRGGRSFGDDRGGRGFGDDRGRSFGDDRGSRSFGDRGFGPRRGFEREFDRGREDNMSENRSRQRLNLQPRTKPLEEPAEPTPAPPSIFGGAKPVDTAAREREIEERLERARQGGGGVSGGGSSDTNRWNSNSRSKSGDRDRGTYAPPARRTEASSGPPPNAWANRGKSEPEGNGRLSPQSDRSEPERRDEHPQSRAAPPKKVDREQAPPSRAVDKPPAGKPRGKPSGERDEGQKPESEDEISRMPKYQDQEAPNFAGSNKFQYLDSEEEQNEASD